MRLHSIHPEDTHLNEQRPDSIFVFSCISREDFIRRKQPTGQTEFAKFKFCPAMAPYCFGEIFPPLSLATRSLQHALTYLAVKRICCGIKREAEPIQISERRRSLAPIVLI